MPTYFVKYGTDEESGIDGYVVKCLSRKMPEYFRPNASTAGIAHDIVDHWKQYKGLSMWMDEFCALGTNLWWSSDTDMLRNDLNAVTSSFYEDVWVDAFGSGFVTEDEVWQEWYHSGKYEAEEVMDEVPSLYQKVIDNNRSDGYGRWLEKYKDKLLPNVLNALSHGYVKGEKYYDYSSSGAIHIHNTIENYVRKHARASVYGGGRGYLRVDEYTPTFKFVVDPKRGDVQCFVKAYDERRYYQR